MATRSRYPTGARPLLVEETARRRRIESRFVGLLEGAGFAEVVLPIIDFAEPYAGVTDRDATRQSYRFTDREGELVAIRSDFTPMVARALAPTIGGAALPLRVFYRGDVIRCAASRLGTNRELFQIGAELVGDASVESDIEVLQLVAAIVRAFDVRPVIVWNDVSVSTGKPAGTATIADVDPPAAQRLERIAALDPDTFSMHLDDVEDAAGYYTGLRFRVYGSDTRTPIAQGGRYDSLYARFGAPTPALGFTFTIDGLED